MKKAKINIEGMTCASCAGHVEKSLSKLPGVKNISVNAEVGKAFLESEDKITEEQLKAAVKEAGYDPVEVEFEEVSTPSPSQPKSPKEVEASKSKPRKESETSKWLLKMIGAWIFTIQLMIIMYLSIFTGKELLPMEVMTPVMLALSFPIIFIFGFKTIKTGLKGFYNFYFSMDSLIALGTIIAYLTGILSFFITIQDYSGVSGMIMTIFITGKYIETKAKGKATSEIKKLLELGAKSARVLRNKQEVEIPIAEIKLGETIIIKPGEKIPTDGMVIKGESSVDESMVTGDRKSVV